MREYINFKGADTESDDYESHIAMDNILREMHSLS